MNFSKRRYTKPQITAHKIDQTICLVMASEGGPPDQPMASPQQGQSNPFENNPFEEKQ